MIKFFRIFVSSLTVLVLLLPCSLPVLASGIEPGELPGSTVETYPDELPIFFNETGINITSQPKDVYAADGVTVSFSVAATGDITSYQWQYRLPTDNVWRDCTSATVGYNTNSVSVQMSSARSGRSYRCIIFNSLGYVVSDAATMYLGDPPATEPEPTDPPVSDSASVAGYLDWFLSFVGDAIGWMGAHYIVEGVSLLHFIIAVGVLCIVVGGILIR